MRRSAAPSYRYGLKRPRFHSPINISENKHSAEVVCSQDISKKAEANSANSDNVELKERKSNPILRSIDEILSIIADPFNSDSDEEKDVTNNESKKKVENKNVIAKTFSIQSSKNNTDENRIMVQKDFCVSKVPSFESSSKNIIKANPVKEKLMFREISDEKKSDSVYYDVLWCKKSMKKHKTWEGDGILIVQNRCAILKDCTGKEIDRASGYKVSEIASIEDGSSFYVGGKECEIQGQISENSYNSGNCFESSQIDSNAEKKSVPFNSSGIECSKPVAKVFRTPLRNLNPIGIKNVQYNLCTDPDAFILPRPCEEQVQAMKEKDVTVVDVVIESFLSKKLRPHQKEGIIFIYKCISGFHGCSGQGVILADEMGLGKTLQCIALVWTLYKQGPFNGVPLLKKIIIITPSSLVTNWQNEFHKWLGFSRLSIFAVDQNNKPRDYIRMPKNVLIISYEMFLRSVEDLSVIPFELVICDEGHRIKNLNIKISNVINCLSTMRRILLTGTPIQNDLAEFFSIIEFVNPGSLGTMSYFRKYFEKPIVKAQNPDCSYDEKELGVERSNELAEITQEFMLRRTQEVINQYLPPKVETVIFCRPSPLQTKLHKHFLQSKEVARCFSAFATADGTDHLMFILTLRKLCNHPSLLLSAKDSKENSFLSYIKSALPSKYVSNLKDSGKLNVLESMLNHIYSGTKKKIVIVSGFTQTLDVIENLCKTKSYQYLRLDGSTNSISRQNLVNSFNRPSSNNRIFLLSSKAGGVGFNLIGAAYILLYDIDWNPANDLQAMARVWRDGQKNTVYVYRLLTAGTIEEKIYQRQISKQGLSRTVFINSNAKAQFTHEELKDLFTFHENVDCLTHDLIACDCLTTDSSDCDSSQNSSKKNLNTNMAELLKWKHIQGPVSTSFPDHCIAAAGKEITFLFRNEVNFTCASSEQL